MQQATNYKTQINAARELGEAYARDGWTRGQVLTHLTIKRIDVAHPLGQFILKTYLDNRKED